jgi:hypothetical protein
MSLIELYSAWGGGNRSTILNSAQIPAQLFAGSAFYAFLPTQLKRKLSSLPTQLFSILARLRDFRMKPA